MCEMVKLPSTIFLLKLLAIIVSTKADDQESVDRSNFFHSYGVMTKLVANLTATGTPYIQPAPSGEPIKIHLYFEVRHIENIYWRTDMYMWNPTDYENITYVYVPNTWRLWQPDIVIVNSAAGIIGHIGYGAKAWLSNVGAVQMFQYATLKVTCDFDFSAYPFDVQRCPVVLRSRTMDLNSAKIDNDTVYLTRDLSWEDWEPGNIYIDKTDLGGWKMIDTTIQVAYENEVTGELTDTLPMEGNRKNWFATAFIWITVKRHTGYYALIAVIPMVFATAVTVAVCFLSSSLLRFSAVLCETILLAFSALWLMSELPPITTESAPGIVSSYAISIILMPLSLVAISLLECVEEGKQQKELSCRLQINNTLLMKLKEQRKKTDDSQPLESELVSKEPVSESVPEPVSLEPVGSSSAADAVAKIFSSLGPQDNGNNIRITYRTIIAALFGLVYAISISVTLAKGKLTSSSRV